MLKLASLIVNFSNLQIKSRNFCFRISRKSDESQSLIPYFRKQLVDSYSLIPHFINFSATHLHYLISHFFSFAIFPSLKVEYNNIRELPLCLLRSYLTDGTQRVKIGECISDPLTVACGVPQRSVLGPLLFLLCIKNIYLSSPIVTFHLFADDTEGVHLTLPSHIFPSK